MTPYRVVVFANRPHPRRRNKIQGVGWIAWNPDHTRDPGRLPGSGSFTWLGRAAAKHAAARAFLDPTVHQVQIRTNQDRMVAIFDRGHGTMGKWEEAA